PMPDVRRAWPQLLRRCYRATQAANLRDGSFCRREHGASCNYGCRRGIPMGNRIVSIIWGTVFALAASGVAFSAGIAVKGPAPVPAPVYNWTGWYVGVNAGASFGNVKTDFNAARLRIDAGDLGIFVPGFAQSDRVYPSGFMGGGQIGYNWQYSPLIVVGLEADFQGALERDSGTFEPRKFSFDVKAGDGSGIVATSYTTQIDWFGTVRARIGYVWGDGNVMSYLTGGLAYGEVKINGTSTVSASICANFFGCDNSVSGAQAFGHSQVNTGWVVGYGTEG